MIILKKLDKINNDENYIRFTNLYEWFHKILNDKIEEYNLKISYLVDKLKFFVFKHIVNIKF